MTSFIPKELFQKGRKDFAETLSKTVEEPWLRVAMLYSLSQMALSGASQEELRGAKNFIHTFLNLAETETATQPYPEKPLKTV